MKSLRALLIDMKTGITPEDRVEAELAIEKKVDDLALIIHGLVKVIEINGIKAESKVMAAVKALAEL